MSERECDHQKGKAGPVIELVNVSRVFGTSTIKAIDKLSLCIEKSEFVVVVGASGSGKSTLLNIIGGIEKTDSGTVTIFQTTPGNNSDWAKLRAKTIGFVFQSFHLLPTLTAVENVEVPLFGQLKGTRAKRRRAQMLLERVGLADRATHTPSRLSGGEKQRVAIARSLANSPSIVLADEPTGNLDSETANEIIALFKKTGVWSFMLT